MYWERNFERWYHLGRLTISLHVFCIETAGIFLHPLQRDFATNVKQINNQSDLIWMSSFAGPSYLAIRFSVYIILIWDPYFFNLYNLWQTWCIYVGRKPRQCGLQFNEQITRTHFLLLQPSIRAVPAQVILLWKGPPKLCIECHPVSVPAKIIWYCCCRKLPNSDWLLWYVPNLSHKQLSLVTWRPFSSNNTIY